MSDLVTLDGRTAIVTGAGHGLGRAEAIALARAGARLVLNDLPGPAVHDVAGEICAAGGQAVVCEGDVADWGTGQELVATAVGRFGGLDILVNNAGVLRDRMIFTMSAEEWDLVLRVHLRGHFVTTRHATAYWREASKQAGGVPVYARIVNTSSEAFLLGSAGQPNYAAAKAGIAALTVVTARSCARYGVLANAICPRARTDMTADLMGAAPDGAVDPLAPQHVAPLVVYLASPASAGITGEVFVVHGGVAAVMEPPRVRTIFLAHEHGSADGMWSLDAIASALAPMSASDPPSAGFACQDTLALAAETVGFAPPSPANDQNPERYGAAE
jgi:NAD(P)-dependent dehydrogenase (short-subunit alcohol dehydrogenase family)